VRQKNVKNILFKNLLDACGGALGFWLLGYGFAYGEGPTFIGGSNFALKGITTGYDYAFFFFQFAFAATAATIVAGTVAERCKMVAYLCYSLMLTGFVYPVVVRSIWSSYGFLSAFSDSSINMIDFAGSGVVHMTGGLTALIAAIVLGPRKGRFYDADGNPLMEPATWPAHSTAMQMLGTFILWFGWYGFNPGSVLTISTESTGDVASLVAVNTTLGACAGAVSAMFTSTLFANRKNGIVTYDLGYTMNGCLTGLVAITAGCATVDPWAAVVIGIVAGWLYLLGSKLLVKFRIDDAVDAIPVHMVGGAWGMISTGLLTSPSRRLLAFGSSDHAGWFYEWGRGSGDFTLLGIQLLSVLYIIAWTGVMMGIFFLVLNYFNLLRVDQLEEEAGMDISRHGGPAYDLDAGAAQPEDVIALNSSRHGLAA